MPLVSARIPKVIITGIGPSYDASFSIWAAECIERGTTLVGVQHGGTYGESVPSHDEKYERSISDLFISWGWSENEKVVPLPATRLMGVSHTRKKAATDNILWVTTADSRYTYFLSLLPLGARFLQYFNSQERFYNSLNKDIIEKLILRLYPYDFRWSMRQRWRDKYHQLRMDDYRLSLREQVERAKMVVIDHFGATTLLEVLTLNKPVIVFGDTLLFEVRDTAKSYYEVLEQVNVLHYSPEDAARTVNAVHGNIETWWNEPVRQDAVNRFKNNFAYTSANDISEWSTFIKNIN
jgi:putative transferase (TIGR04331 family)